MIEPPRPLTPTTSSPTRHGEFYISNDQLSVFQVQNSLFKAHRHILVDNSLVFRDMFALPAATGEIEGNSDDHPIQLQGVMTQEFASLMKVLYHGELSHKPAFHIQHAALSISHRFDLQDVHERTVHNLRAPPSEAKLCVPLLAAAEKYGVDFKDMVDALKMVVEREAFL
ncbi:hypothetical protein OF83DRAFT_1295434 [Amylostereum chailletii]|nr:hypothetical protein OF83DRAFT_1295434 [Amylostereum chailletii]